MTSAPEVVPCCQVWLPFATAFLEMAQRPQCLSVGICSYCRFPEGFLPMASYPENFPRLMGRWTERCVGEITDQPGQAKPNFRNFEKLRLLYMLDFVSSYK